jgi:hypothetical protein
MDWTAILLGFNTLDTVWGGLLLIWFVFWRRRKSGD